MLVAHRKWQQFGQLMSHKDLSCNVEWPSMAQTCSILHDVMTLYFPHLIESAGRYIGRRCCYKGLIFSAGELSPKKLVDTS